MVTNFAERVTALLRRRHARTVTGVLAAALAAGAASPTAIAASPKTLYVSPHGSNANPCTRTAPCKTISDAVARAHRGDTVIVAQGTYFEQVTVTTDISVVGVGSPTLNASGHVNGFLIAARGTVVRGFVVERATYEGILAMSTSRVTIANNTVRNNGVGSHARHKLGECRPKGHVPEDCGEGIHLMSASNLHVTGNVVTGNDGGILLSDENGPTARNVISKNFVLNNASDCGITLAGHNMTAVVGGIRQPRVAGVYANEITDNVANHNGTKGQGGGILLAAGAPGSAVYKNLVRGNTASGNGLAGVTLHSNAPGQDLNGNAILDNELSHDGVLGDPSFSEARTVGILVASAVTKLTGTVIRGNTIKDSHFGIWTENVPPIQTSANTFVHVAVPVKQS